MKADLAKYAKIIKTANIKLKNQPSRVTVELARMAKNLALDLEKRD